MEKSTNPQFEETRGSSDTDSDQSLLDRFREGHQDAATRLYGRYAHRLKSLVSAKMSTDLSKRMEADDVVQSVFRTFFRRASEGQYDVPQDEDLWKLFLVIALNKIRTQATFHRAAKRDVRAEIAGSEGERQLDSVGKDDSSAQAYLQCVMDEILAQMTPVHRQIVEMRLMGFEVAEIATQIKRSKRTTERVLQQIRARLEEIFQQDSQDG